jgi:YD repeat-containing protein
VFVLQNRLPIKVLANLYSRLSLGFVTCLVFAVLCIGFYKPALSAVERYGYDPIGRLIQFIDSSGRVTEYTYDAAGNVISVRGGGVASDFAPVLSSVTPNVIRRGETKSIVLVGQRLQAGTLQVSHPGLSLLNLQQTPTEIRADLRASDAAPLGTQAISYENAAGSSSISVTVAPALPVLAAEPSPLALPPDNAARSVTLRLSSADAIPHTVNLAFSDPAKASVSPASVTFAAGQTSVLVSVTPRASGFSTLQLTSSTLASLAVPVFVTSDFRGVNTSNAKHVGVVVEGPTTQQPSAQALFSSPSVGVAVGSILSGVSPKGMQIGSVQNLVITGVRV